MPTPSTTGSLLRPSKDGIALTATHSVNRLNLATPYEVAVSLQPGNDWLAAVKRLICASHLYLLGERPADFAAWRRHFMANWIYLPGSLPMVEQLRWARLLQLWRVYQLFREHPDFWAMFCRKRNETTLSGILFLFFLRFGVGLFGAISGFMASIFLQPA